LAPGHLDRKQHPEVG